VPERVPDADIQHQEDHDTTDRESVRVLLVSFDAARDTPEVLRTLLERHQVSADAWRFVSATEDGAREVSAVLGIKYRGDDGTFNHSSVITLLDREGKIDLRVDGMVDTHDTVAARVHALAQRR
jgi:protein SCO1/2